MKRRESRSVTPSASAPCSELSFFFISAVSWRRSLVILGSFVRPSTCFIHLHFLRRGRKGVRKAGASPFFSAAAPPPPSSVACHAARRPRNECRISSPPFLHLPLSLRVSSSTINPCVQDRARNILRSWVDFHQKRRITLRTVLKLGDV